VHGFAGSLGSRLSNRAGMGFAAGKYAQLGPTPEMLRAYYRLVYVTTGAGETGVFGPFNDRSQDEVSLLNDYLTSSSGTAQPRGLYIAGSGFAQSETATSGTFPSHGTFLSSKLGASLRNSSYGTWNTGACADVIETAVTGPNIYGVANGAPHSNDVLNVNPSLPSASVAAFYENVGVNGPYVASVTHATTVTQPWVSLLDGFGIQDLVNRYCVNANGRPPYLYDVFTHVFSALCTTTGPAGSVTGVEDTPVAVTNLTLMSNPAIGGRAGLRLALAHADRAEVAVYDLAGRHVRQLVDGPLHAGMHDLVWDGHDGAGNPVAAGVYFVRVRLAQSGFVQSRTLILMH
jgi:hypothetical protein